MAIGCRDPDVGRASGYGFVDVADDFVAAACVGHVVFANANDAAADERSLVVGVANVR